MQFSKLLIGNLLFLLLLPALAFAKTTTTAEHTILVSNYSFTPSELTILPGETVAFVNVEGLHAVNGVNNTLTGESFNNPVEFFLPEVEGEATGVLIGEITFDQPGVYNYDCSVGFHAQLGMVASITVDAFTVADLISLQDSVPDISLSAIAFNTYLNPILNGDGPITVFVPNQAAVAEVGELMSLNQFDLLGFFDLGTILEYHIATGALLAEDLEDGMSLPTIYGQDLTITEVNGVLLVDGAAIVSTNYIADNGIVHVIDKCLAPSDLPQATVWDIVKNSDDHQILRQAIINTDLKEELQSQNDLDPSLDLPGPFTVFAPTDAAFEAYSQEVGMTVVELLAGQSIDEIVKTHVIGNQIESAAFNNGQQVQNYLNEFNQMTVNSNGILVEGIALQATDLEAYNGLVHVINELITPDLPPTEGTCGAWTLTLNGSDWDEDESVLVVVNGTIISTETVLIGNTSTFQFGVDVDAEVHLIYYGSSFGHSFNLYDDNNNLIYQSSASSDFPASSAYGLKACTKPSSCGDVEIEMFNYSGYGWPFGSLNVFINEEFYQAITMPDGYAQKAYVPTSVGDTLSFVFNAGAFPEEHSYIINAPDGTELANQFEFNQVPEDVIGLVICEDLTNSTNELSAKQFTTVYPNPTCEVLNIDTKIEILNVQLYDLLSRQVEATYKHGAIDISSLARNTYILKIETIRGTEVHKLMIIN